MIALLFKIGAIVVITGSAICFFAACLSLVL
jgi:hypothetical protein